MQVTQLLVAFFAMMAHSANADLFPNQDLKAYKKYIDSLLLQAVPPHQNPLPDLIPEEMALPSHFDSRDAWLGCADAVYDQGRCGSCWAVSAAGVLNDRFCIHHPDFADLYTTKKDTGDLKDNISNLDMDQVSEQDQEEQDQELKAKRREKLFLEAANKDGTSTMNRLFQRGGSCVQDGFIDDKHGCHKKVDILSPQTMVSCCLEIYDPVYNSHGCNGGEAYDAWEFLKRSGLSRMSIDGRSGCSPYLSATCALSDPQNNGCHVCGFPNECSDSGVEPTYYKAKDWGRITTKGLFRDSFLSSETQNDPEYAAILKSQVEKIMAEIYTNGPVHACYDVFANFQPFFNDKPNGVYASVENTANNGGHCVALVGWGTDAASGVDYWITRNSWGESFSNRGFFRIARGYNLVNIEFEVYAGCPAGTKCKLTQGVTPGVPPPPASSPDVPVPPPTPSLAPHAQTTKASGGKWIHQQVSAPLAQQHARLAMLHHNQQLVSRGHDLPTRFQTKYTILSHKTRIVDGVLSHLVMELPEYAQEIANKTTAEIYLHQHHTDPQPKIVSLSLRP